MAEAVIMPRQGQSVESCLITAINKKQGDVVETGDILFSYETDKSAFDEESKLSGTVLSVLFEEGDDVACLDSVMIIGKEGEDISAFLTQNKIQDNNDNNKPEEVAEKKADFTASASVTASSGGEVKISPRARDYAKQARVDFAKAVPTGPNGRIIERDIAELIKVSGGERFADDSAAGVTEDTAALLPEENNNIPVKESELLELYTDVKLPNIRKIIAKAMHTSLSEMAQLTLNSSFDASAILNFRQKLKNNAQSLELENITLNDIILYAVSKTLVNHRDVNAHYLGDIGVIRYFNAVNLGIAADTKRGLVVPVISGAEKLSLNELAKQTKKIISEAQNGSLAPDKLKGGTFTVTNLGSLGIESFTPVINPPQTCILGVNNITRRVKQVNNQDIFYDCMALSLTFDHRALDGAPAARFLKELCANLENFDLLLAK
ncbi:MAG: 2-oxo acid dehydrogenase subunit E2 [Oscillospiraceae bacterium]|nr:2-oxo acid dehydrogenase subunit E2 [Oscillospiraceae bacterium]